MLELSKNTFCNKIKTILQWAKYAKFWKIYLRQAFSFEYKFKLLPKIQVFFCNDEHLLRSNLLNHKNVIYNRKKSCIAIMNDSKAVIQFCEYKINYYKGFIS